MSSKFLPLASGIAAPEGAAVGISKDSFDWMKKECLSVIGRLALVHLDPV